jgi:hypothetical protein
MPVCCIPCVYLVIRKTFCSFIEGEQQQEVPLPDRNILSTFTEMYESFVSIFIMEEGDHYVADGSSHSDVNDCQIIAIVPRFIPHQSNFYQ